MINKKMTSFIKKVVKKVHHYLLCRKEFFKLNRFIYKIALHGIGVLNFENVKVSGEKYFLNKISKSIKNPTVFDIGANIGNYTKTIIKSSPRCTIYAFEPHPKNFEKLNEKFRKKNVTKVNSACGNTEGTMKIYDYDDEGSSHASAIEGVIKNIHNKDKIETEVPVIKVDSYVSKKNIDCIDLLKVDTEGYELKVLKGAEEIIKKGGVRCLHIEFNEMNVESRTFMKDIIEFLTEYKVYRMFPNGLVEIKKYNPPYHEIFAYQNIVAIHKKEKKLIQKLS
jgi:FkbM family methyltransferase